MKGETERGGCKQGEELLESKSVQGGREGSVSIGEIRGGKVEDWRNVKKELIFRQRILAKSFSF